MDKNINLEQTNINMRIWLSSGKGDFGIYSYVYFNNKNIFFN